MKRFISLLLVYTMLMGVLWYTPQTALSVEYDVTSEFDKTPLETIAESEEKSAQPRVEILTTEEGTIYSGTCGENVTWILDEEGVITISGTGPMDDYDHTTRAPWYDYRSSIKTVIVEEGVTRIGNMAFQYCVNITTVKIAEGLTSIGVIAFTSYKISSLSVPNSITEVDTFAFSLSSNSSGWTRYDNAYYIGNEENPYVVLLKSADRYSTTCIVHPDTKVIAASAFSDNNTEEFQLSEVVFPDGLTHIGAYAFADCKRLTEITLGGNVTSVGDGAFSDCQNLVSVTLGASVVSIGDYAFENCKSLTDLSIPDSLRHVGQGAFEKTASLAYNEFDGAQYLGNSQNPYVLLVQGPRDSSFCEIHEDTVLIGKYAFSNCSAMCDIVIPASVCVIDQMAFSGCASLQCVYFRGNPPVIADDAFDNTDACVYFSDGNTTWTTDAQQNYGGELTWSGLPDDGHVLMPSTYIEEGYTTFTCLDCGYQYTDYYSACKHAYTAVITAPTCTVQGYTTYTCGLCRDKYVDSYTDALWHDFIDGVCTRCNVPDEYYINEATRVNIYLPYLGYTYDAMHYDGIISISPEATLTKQEAAVYLRYCMIYARQQMEISALFLYADITYYDSEPASEDTILELLNAAVGHGSAPALGDAYFSGDSGWSLEVIAQKAFILESELVAEGVYRNVISYVVPIFANVDEIDFVAENVKAIIQELDLEGKDDYDKIKLITQYICDRIEYAYGHSAYEALKNNKAVCDGYAKLTYALLMEAGIDCRYIAGQVQMPIGHAWNIVKLDGQYYNLDTTWCDQEYPGRMNEDWFLRGATDFERHFRSGEYATDEFHTQYPMATTKYDGTVGFVHDCNGNHDYDIACDDHIMSYPTLTTSGLVMFTCSWCSKVSYYELPPLNTDDYTYTVTKEPTCTTDGEATYEWRWKGWKISIEPPIPALGHNSIVTDFKAATCTEDGYEACTCSVCGESYTEVIPATGHQSTHTERLKDATCGTDGYSGDTVCDDCGTIVETGTIIPATGEHAYSEWVVITEPTTEESGLRERHCANCGHTEQEVMEPLAVLVGDVNGDGRINVRDARAILRYIAGLVGEDELEVNAADFNGDGRVNVRDARAILNYIAGMG